MKDETIIKIAAFTLMAIMYVVTVTRQEAPMDMIQALWTAILGLISTIIGYNIGKEIGKHK